MLLNNLHIVAREGLHNILVSNDKIKAIESSGQLINHTDGELEIDFTNAIAFPGLINSHDHLDFNLFPQIGNRIYNNYAEWGKEIHQKYKAGIDAILKIPEHTRTKWGMYKNLLNGITTVANHGKQLNITDNFITVIQNIYNLHSVQFEKNWKLKLIKPFPKNENYIIHLGEGTDEVSHKEIDKLIKWNLLKRKIIAVHGVAMDAAQASSFKALIWCPASNYFLLNKTADINRLKNKITILFGTDSTLTSSWNLYEHLLLARKTNFLSDKELFEMLTVKPAAVLNLEDTGKIEEDFMADIVIAKKNTASNNFDSFFSLKPEDILLVIHHGEIKLFDEDIEPQLLKFRLEFSAFGKIYINGRGKYVYGNLKDLIKEILSFHPKASLPISI